MIEVLTASTATGLVVGGPGHVVVVGWGGHWRRVLPVPTHYHTLAADAAVEIAYPGLGLVTNSILVFC